MNTIKTKIQNLTQIARDNLLMILTTSYVALCLIATIVATKVTFIFGLSAAAGIIVYPLTFMVKDMIQKKFGRKVARVAIWLSALVMLFAFLIFWVVGQMPSDAHWTFQTAYNEILTPVGRLVAGSVAAMVISELLDTYFFSVIFRKGKQLTAALVGNIIGILVDSLIFTTIAFMGTMPRSVLIGIFISNTVIKLIMTVIGSPSIFLVKRTTTEVI